METLPETTMSTLRLKTERGELQGLRHSINVAAEVAAARHGGAGSQAEREKRQLDDQAQVLLKTATPRSSSNSS